MVSWSHDSADKRHLDRFSCFAQLTRVPSTQTRFRLHFENSVPKVFPTSPIDVSCSHFVKSSQLEIGEILRCLSDNKKFAWLSSCRYCADRAQNLPGPASDNVLRVLQISSKSVHFRRRYSRTREHLQNAP